MILKKFILFIIFFTSAFSHAKVIDLKNYPNLNNFESTLLYSKLDGFNGQLLNLKFRRMDNKNLVQYPFRYYKQKGSAPLLFLLTGLGGNQNSKISQYLAELLYKRGYHVVLLGSTFSPEFLESAASIPFAGQAKLEAKDLYQVLYNLKSYFAQEPNKITGWGLTGYSYGALVGAHLARLDSIHKVFKFKRYLLINPPVDVFTSLRQLDQYYSLYQSLNVGQVAGLAADLVSFNSAIDKIDFNELDQINNKMTVRLSQTKMKSLIGKAFNHTLKIALRSSDKLLFNSSKQFESTSRFGYTYYAKNTILDYFSTNTNGQKKALEIYGTSKLSIEELNKQNSLTGLEQTLRTNNKITVFHNTDDFLLNQKNFQFLERNLNQRLYLFSKGGHVGNIWHYQVQDYIFDVLDSSF